MINNKLHATPVALDREQHKNLKLTPLPNLAAAAQLNSMFVAGVEFGDASREYPVVFVHAGNDDAGKPQMAPVAIFGLTGDENLYLNADQSWRAEYVPAMLRTYPFAIARMDAERYAVCVDTSCESLNTAEGQPLFGADGQPSEFMNSVHEQLRQLEVEVQRTQQLCNLLVAKDLLRDMRFDADLPDGKKLSVDGFLTVDDKRMNELSDADVLELYRSGALALIHAHQLSLPHMRRLVNWRLQRDEAKTTA